MVSGINTTEEGDNALNFLLGDRWEGPKERIPTERKPPVGNSGITESVHTQRVV